MNGLFVEHADRSAAASAARRRRRRLRRPAFGHAQAVASSRRRAALLRRQHVARRHAHGRRSSRARAWSAPAGSTNGKMVIYPIREQHRRARAPARSTGLPRSRRQGTATRATGTGPATLRGLHRRLRRLAFRLARRAGDDPRDRFDSRVPDGRPGPAAVVDAGSRHAAGRCRAPDACRAAPTARARRFSTREPSRTHWPAHRAATLSRRSSRTKPCGCPATTEVVLTNRQNPPDAINREVWQRTGDKPFARIDDVISQDELRAMSERYKRVAGYDRESLGRSMPVFRATSTRRRLA